MSKRQPISRRAVLRGAGGYFVAIPFLEAMLPSLAFAQSALPKRFITSFAGTVVGPDNISGVSGYGPLPMVMPPGWKALESVRNYVSLISNCSIPTYQSLMPSAPASAYNMQHKTTPAPMLAGVSSKEIMSVMVGGMTADQVAARVIAGSTKFQSLQLRVQAIAYSGSNNTSAGIMSAVSNGGALNALAPIVSPLQLYQLLFSNMTLASTGGGSLGIASTGKPTPLDRKKSVLDLVADDAKRLTSQVSGNDRIRLEQHFEEIRKIERSIAASTSGGSATGGTTTGGSTSGGSTSGGMTTGGSTSGGSTSGGMTTGGSTSGGAVPPSPGGSCMKPANPGPDPAVGPNQFGSWSDETRRGQLMADMIAYAIACDMTRVVSWMLSFDQVFMKNQFNGSTDMHDDSHNISVRNSEIAANTNWHATMFARLVSNLVNLQEAGQPLINNTFLSLLFAEGKTAHSRVGMRHLVAGCPSFLKLGQHIDAAGAHPARIQIAGLQAVGAGSTLGELTGPMSVILK